ncbi:hypothetical protein CCACVL1_04372 [Corchorus capsularis]|uniref:TF-B3 domain-containing protein n=1 Tax=Corchorus capsularis TaxID=210143 RepID=A0A1R3JTF1_COCAP|nr:hypothetical protein CCACVL1_04372 [Corchorus capsularis]
MAIMMLHTIINNNKINGHYENPGPNFLQSVPMHTPQECAFRKRGRPGYIWTVNLELRGNLLVFRSGWPAFARAMRLKIGDLCTFTFIEREDDGCVVIDAERTRKSDLKKDDSPPPNITKFVMWGEGDNEHLLKIIN